MKTLLNRFRASFGWVYFIARRFAKVDGSGRTAVSSFLSSLGICFGTMTLIVTVSVMNGFQTGFIESILEISSAHIRAAAVNGGHERDMRFEQSVRALPEIAAAVPFYEAQGLLGSGGRQAAALIRAVPDTVCDMDAGFAREVRMVSGSFSIAEPNTSVLGWELARSLGVYPGQRVDLFALSGGADAELFSADRMCLVTGLFQSGYGEINSSFAFVSLETGEALFGSGAPVRYNIKLHRAEQDIAVIGKLAAQFPDMSFESWRSYNRAFFGALRIEKNMLLLLVLLIFIVVGVNIYNSMRRMVYERREEIAVLSALGGSPRDIHVIFIVRGVLTGLCGALPGLALGLLICVQMESVFMLLSRLSYWAQFFFCMLVSPEQAVWVQENPMFQVYAQIPARPVPGEILMITILGIFSALAASWAASRRVLELRVAEVLHDD